MFCASGSTRLSVTGELNLWKRGREDLPLRRSDNPARLLYGSFCFRKPNLIYLR